MGGAWTLQGAVLAGVAAGMGLLGAIAAVRQPVNPDVAWLLQAGQRTLAGERLYIDILETNPPLIVWLNAALVLVARTLGAAELSVVLGAVTAFSLAGALLAGAILRDSLRVSWWAGAVVFLGMLYAVMVLPSGDFGQREHLFIAGLLPYLALTAARLEGRWDGRLGRDALVGGIAGIGFALKPHFVVAWFAVELVVWLRLRKAALRRPEFLVVVALLGVYASAVLLAAPEYLSFTGSFVSPLYPYWLPAPLNVLVSSRSVAIALLSLVLFSALRPRAWRASFGVPASLALLAMVLLLFVQGKGFSYHYFPLRALSLLLLSLTVAEALEKNSLSETRLLRYARAAGVALLVCLGIGALLAPPRATLARGAADQAVREEVRREVTDAGAERVLVLAPGGEVAYPATVEAGATSVSSFYSLWPLAALALRDRGWRPSWGESATDWRELERFVMDRLARDLRAGPDLIVIDRAPLATVVGLIDLDLPRLLRRDKESRDVLSGYRLRSSSERLEVYERRASR